MSVLLKKDRRKGKEKKHSGGGLCGAPLGASGWIEIRRDGKDGRRSAYLCEVDKILKYSDAEIVLRRRRETVSFVGDMLSIESFRSGIVTVTGRLQKIEFGGGNG